MWVAANGGSLFTEAGEPQLNSPEAVEALDFTAGLVNDQAPWSQFKAFRDTWDFFGGKNQFVSDQLGAFPMEDWYVDVLGEATPDIELTTVPFETREGEPLTYATGTAWAMPKGGQNQASACAFMKIMTEADTWVAAAEASKKERVKGGQAYVGTFTGNEDADERIFSEVYEPTGHPALDEATDAIREVQESAFSDPASPASAEIKKAWEDAVLRVLEGEQSAQESLDQAQEEAEQAVERANQ
jgi:multiple sugar transport system substrate-binding protein